MADGSIRIEARIDKSKLAPDLKEMEQMCGKTADKIEEMSAQLTPKSNKQLEADIRAANKALTEYEAKLDDVNKKIAERKSYTEEQLPKAATDEQAENLLQMEENDLKELNAQRDELNAKIDAEYEKISKAEEQQRALAEAAAQQKAAIDEAKASAAAEKQSIAEAAKAQREQAQAAKETARAQKEAAKAAKSQTGFEKMLTSMRKGFENLSQSIDSTAGKVMRFGLGLLGVRGIMSVLQRATSSYMSSNEELSETLSSCWSVLGELVGPAIEWLIGVLQKAIAVIDYFLAQLAGIGIIARANERALNKQSKAAGGAAKALQQASFDEQNKLNDSSGGGGGGGAAKLFDFELDEKDKDAIDKIVAVVKEILNYADLIAGAFAAWKISRAFGGSLKDAAGWALIVGGAIGEITNFIDQWNNGIDWKSFKKNVVSSGALIAGLGLKFGTTGAGIGLVATGILDVISAIKDWHDKGYLAEEAFATLEKGILSVGAGLTLLTGSWIPLAIAAVVALVTAVAKYGDQMGQKIEKARRTVREFFDGIIQNVSEFFNNLINKTGENMGVWGAGIQLALIVVRTSVETTISFIEGIITSVMSVVEAMVSGIHAMANGDWKAAWEAWKKPFVDIWNSMKSTAETVVNGIIDAINIMIDAINLLGIGINRLDYVDWGGTATKVSKNVGKVIGGSSGLQRNPHLKLAQGGIVNNPGAGVLATVGEAGKEAVLPLENNTGWMDELAMRLNGGGGDITIPIFLDGKKIANYVIDSQKKRAFALNGV